MYDKVCISCGRKLSEFFNTYMLGCPDCYKAFEREIALEAKKIHGSYVHTGKTPKTVGVDRELLNEYEMLIKAKEQAALDGNFSHIKELSDAIIDLSKELKRRGLL